MPSADALRERLREALGRRPPASAPGLGPPNWRLPQAASVPVPPRPAESSDLHHLLPGYWLDNRLGSVFVREQQFPLEHQHGRLALGRALETSTAVWARIGRHEPLAAVAPRRTAFIDIETTGLAGGTGTTAFLVGVGHFQDGHFLLRQFFLSSLAQEGAMMRALAERLDGFEALVTFNGKTFDVPLLHTRLVMTGTRGARRFTELPHLDLLHPARRLYRDRLESCRLGDLEQRLLGVTRVDDVPGAEIPSLYFRYLRTRRARPLLGIFEHNALDVLSLVTLTVHLARVFGGESRLMGADRLALGRDCEAQGQRDEAAGHYEAALALELRSAEREECEQRLSLLCKKLGRWEEAVALWRAVALRPGNRTLYPLVELAKYHERVTRDLDAARLMTERALLLLESHHARMGYAGLVAQRAALQARLLRLEERAARQRARPSRRKSGTSIP